MNTKSKAVILFSGGLDTTTCLFWAVKKYAQIEAITFDYGQKNIVEKECATKIVAYIKKHFKVKIHQTFMSMNIFKDINDSALLKCNSTNVLARHSGNKKLPSVFVPARNIVFITIGAMMAYKMGIRDIITGVNKDDYSGYPDCRPNFIQEMNWAINSGMGRKMKIVTPLLYKTKKEIFEMAEKLGALDEIVCMSHTCDIGDRSILHSWGYGCGKCDCCVVRKAGHKKFVQMQWRGYDFNSDGSNV